MARGSAAPLGPAWHPSALVVMACALCSREAAAQPNIDGGRSDLPGMKQDIFDQVNKHKKGGGAPRPGKGPPECPKSDKMSPFSSMAWVGAELFVRLDDTEGPCHKFESLGGANLTVLKNASRTCGPIGEWKLRISENMSSVFFQGGLEWVRSDNETIEVITEEGTFQTAVSEEKYEKMLACWRGACGCEQAANPKMRLVLFSLLVISVGCISYESVLLAIESCRGKKPPKHVECKKGHRMVEVNYSRRNFCDICRKAGTTYQCNKGCNYDMCKECFKAAKKKVRAKYKDWLERHPEDEDNKKKDKGDDDKDDDDAKKDDSQSEAGDKKETKKESEAESDAPPDDSEAEKSGATEEDDKTQKATAEEDDS